MKIKLLVARIKALLRKSDYRGLVENFVSLVSLRFLGMALPLITLPYILRVIGFENYGIIIFAVSVVAYFQSLTDYSFILTATRDVAIFKNSQRKLNLIYSKVLTIKLLFFLVSVLLINSLPFLYDPFREYQLIFFLTSLSLLGNVLFPEWFFRGIEKMKFITVLNLTSRIIFTLCVFIFIKKEEDYWIYPLLETTGLLIAGITGQIILVHKYRLRFHFIKLRSLKNTIVSNFPIFVNQFTPTLYNNTSAFILGLIGTPYALGVYGAIKKIMLLELSLINILNTVFFPFLSRRKNAFKKVSKIIIISSGIILFIPLLLSNMIFWFLNIDDPSALYVLIIMNIGAFFISMYYVYGTNYFIVHRMDKIVMKNTIVASLIGLSLAYPLISSFGYIGAAINVAFSQLIMGLGLYLKYLRKR